MPSDEEWCQTQLNNLRLNDRRLETLAELRHHLTAQPAASWTHSLPVPDIFAGVAGVVCQLPGSEPTATANACDILTLCMASLAIADADDDASAAASQSSADGSRRRWHYVLECLLHASIDVRLVGLNETQRLLAAGAAPPLDPDTVGALVACLLHDSERVGQPAVRMLAQLVPGWLAAGVAGTPVFDTQALLESIADRSDVIKCRVYELAVVVASGSPADLKSVDGLLSGGLLHDLQVGWGHTPRGGKRYIFR